MSENRSACPNCGVEVAAGQWACRSCGASLVPQYDAGLRPSVCPICSGEVRVGSAQLRTSAGAEVVTVFDAGLAWTFLDVVTATCVRCGHIDLYAR